MRLYTTEQDVIDYSHSDSPIDEYIDLIPILKEQSIDPAAFLTQIQEVKILE